ncbi:MarR family winged helix-turn-helix transcriptional regulator [Actinophytocola sp.]|uniref:MarR family winged helix-turn-helix transcriptional regulator n=1 Tax=Actinophytocola sp. TaxID=1872138 RepID=UPI002D2BC17A|nr:MarR family transcriptional regulator [Actinophytocola sp.]HYQ67390.1 MarR family transcriptional regulator [Actinophytocola sp.]
MAETVDEANQMMRLLRRLTTLADATLASAGEVLAEFGLTVSAASLLCALDPRAETPTMRDLSRQMRCDPSTISLMADKLDRSGLVERRPHPTDGRKRTLALTDRGVEVWAALSARLGETSALAVLSVEERRTLEELLAKAQSG